MAPPRPGHTAGRPLSRRPGLLEHTAPARPTCRFRAKAATGQPSVNGVTRPSGDGILTVEAVRLAASHAPARRRPGRPGGWASGPDGGGRPPPGGRGSGAPGASAIVPPALYIHPIFRKRGSPATATVPTPRGRRTVAAPSPQQPAQVAIRADGIRGKLAHPIGDRRSRSGRSVGKRAAWPACGRDGSGPADPSPGYRRDRSPVRAGPAPAPRGETCGRGRTCTRAIGRGRPSATGRVAASSWRRFASREYSGDGSTVRRSGAAAGGERA